MTKLKSALASVPFLLVTFVLSISAFTITTFDIIKAYSVRHVSSGDGIHYVALQANASLSANKTHTMASVTGTEAAVTGATTSGHLAAYTATAGELVDGGAAGATCPGTATNGQVLWDNAGVCGGISGVTSDGTNMTAGAGNFRATSPLITTSIFDTNGLTLIGLTATATAVNNFTIANSATGNNPTFGVSGSDTNIGMLFLTKGSGTIMTQNTTGTSPGWYTQLTGDTVPRVRVGLNAADVASIGFGPGNATRDAFWEREGPANLRQGGPASAAPTPQILSFQNVVAGTSNTAGANFTLVGSQGTGTGVGGSIILRVSPAGSTGTAVNASVNTVVFASDLSANFSGAVISALSAPNEANVQFGVRGVNHGMYSSGNNLVQFAVGGAKALFLDSTNTTAIYNQSWTVSWGSSTTTSPDSGLGRLSAGAVAVNNSVSCSTVANCRDLAQRHNLATGTVCTIASGFGAGAAFVGSCRDDSLRIGVGTTPGVTGVITFGTAYTNIPSCTANDETTAVLIQAVPTTSQVTLNGVFVNSDVISVVCKGRI